MRTLFLPLLLASLWSCVISDIDFVRYNYGFTDPDSKRPEIASTLPANWSIGVEITSTIEITFSERFFFGYGSLYIWSPGDARTIPATDPQLSRTTANELTVVFRPHEPLQGDVEYNVFVSPGFVTDLAGNNYLGGVFMFRTVAVQTRFIVFAPYVQAPNSPLIVAFKTAQHVLYGTTDKYVLVIAPSNTNVFLVPSTGAGNMDERCASIVEVSPNFPALEECRVRDGHFRLALRAALYPDVEYSLVIVWPISSAPTSEYEVFWNLIAEREYEGVIVEVERFASWRHQFRDYWYNDVEEKVSNSLLSFTMTPSDADTMAEWLGPGTVCAFRIQLDFGDPGLKPGDRIILVASPLTVWSIDPARPTNLTVLRRLDYSDPFMLSDPIRRPHACPHFFPGDLPYNTQCRLLELGLGTYTYGIELRLPQTGANVIRVVNESRAFELTLPGVDQPLAIFSRWEAIFVSAQSGQDANKHGIKRDSTQAIVVNTSDGMDFRVLASSHPYPEPVGTRVNRVDLEFETGVFALGKVDVLLELLEPHLAQIERCEAPVGAPRLMNQLPSVTNIPTSTVRWELEPLAAGPGPASYVAFPRVSYRTSCLVYNGPQASPTSQWRLSVAATSAQGDDPLVLSRTYIDHTYFVAALMAGAQVTPTLPLLGRQQVILVRVTLPRDDGITLDHWKTTARHLLIRPPLGFVATEGPCLGYRPLTSSALPPIPLSTCLSASKASQVSIDLSISDLEPGFQPGLTYAFRTVIGNPSTWDQVESRVIGNVEINRGNQWRVSLLVENVPVVMLEDVPQAFAAETTAVKPEVLPRADDTSFRIFQRPLTVHDIVAADPHIARATRVTLTIELSTQMRSSDLLQITAPSAFSFLRSLMGSDEGDLFGSAIPFPMRAPEVLPNAPWIFRTGLVGTAEVFTQYAIALQVQNPSSWSSLDTDFNYWVFETFYSAGGLLDKRSRRNIGVAQGYQPMGTLLSCLARPLSRLNNVETWVTFAFRLTEPVFAHSWLQARSPVEIHIGLPNGFHFPSRPESGDCEGLLSAEAFVDYPLLPTSHFPHAYSIFESLSGFTCRLDDDNLVIARTLIVTARQPTDFGLMPNLLYTFRIKVLTPLFDKIWDVQWTLKTVDFYGDTYEECSITSIKSVGLAEGEVISTSSTGIAVNGDAQGAAMRLPLPTRRLSITFSVMANSLKTTLDGNYSLQVQAPPRFVFLRDCLGSLDPFREDSSWVLLSCEGYSAVANLNLMLVGDASPLTFVMYARAPPFAQPDWPSEWGLQSIGSHDASEANQLEGSLLREMELVTLQPVGIPYFKATPSAQDALLSIVSSVVVPLGSFVQISAPRHASFSFDQDHPCNLIQEDPAHLNVTVGTTQTPAASTEDSPRRCGQICTWPQLSSCGTIDSGVKLLLQFNEELDLAKTYCIRVRTRGPMPQTEIILPMSATLREERTDYTLDVYPLMKNDRGQGWSSAPFVRQAIHLSICHGSRVPSLEPTEFLVHMMPSSLGVSRTEASIYGQICLNEATLALAQSHSAVCRILEPNAPDANCSVPTDTGCGNRCLTVTGPIWIPFQRIVVSLFAHVEPGAIPRADLKVFDGSGSLLQGSSRSLLLPVLNRLTGVTISAPRTASTTIAFPIRLSIDWNVVRASFLDSLERTQHEEPAYLDIDAPPGLRISLSCEPIACERIAPDMTTPRPGMRLLLQRVSAGSGLQLNSVAQGVLDVRLLAMATYPLAPDDPINKWGLILRGNTLRALGAAVYRGFSIAELMQVRVESSSQRAGDVFSRFIVEVLLQVDLFPGDTVLLHAPSAKIPCDALLAEPPSVIGPLTSSATAIALPGAQNASCALEFRMHLHAGVKYSFNVPIKNPILTPQPNIWFLQTFSRHNTFATSDPGVETTATHWVPHSVAEGPGFEVSGEFEVFRVRSKSSFPTVLSPTALRFKLRTPLPPTIPLTLGPSLQKPVVILRLKVAGQSSSSISSGFDANQCMLDILRDTVLVPEETDAELLQPDDCLVSKDNSTIEFIFMETFGSARSYVIWTWMRNPSIESTDDETFVYSASTLVEGGQVVHRISLRPDPLLGVRAMVVPGSFAVGAVHRAVVRILGGRTILGQRGSIEVELPQGFEGTCSENHFRPRPALPATARCRNHLSTDTTMARIVVYWRTLFGATKLEPPYEFSFELKNRNTLQQHEGRKGAWHIRLYEGDNQEFPVDGTPRHGIRPFNLCQALTMTVKREDARVISIVFEATNDLEAGFDNLVRVQILSSSRAPAMAACPDTSIWQRRTGLLGHSVAEAGGLPIYTTCVTETFSEAPPEYRENASQHLSSVLFLLPYQRFRSAEPYGLEVILDRPSLVTALAEDSPSELAAEMVSLSVEARGERLQCASAPLGLVPTGSQAEIAADGDGEDSSPPAEGAADASTSVVSTETG